MQMRYAFLAGFSIALSLSAAPWKVIGPGGGGAQFYPTVSPHDSNTVLVRCDMTGAYITRNAGADWRMFNLRGTVSFFAFDPSDPKTMYAEALGLFRSTDSGRTWRLVYPDPSNVDRIVMPDDHAGERIVTKDGRAGRISAFAVDPLASKTLYASIMENRTSATLQVSTDWGKSWKKLTDLSAPARKIYVDRAHNVYLIGSNSVSVWRDGALKANPPSPGNFLDASAGFAGGKMIVYAVAPGAVLVSEDSGATWTKKTLAPGDAPMMRAVATSLNHPDVVYVSYSYRGGDRTFGVAKSTDRGVTWNFVWKERGDQKGDNIDDPWMDERFGPGWGESPISLGVGPNNPDVCYGTNYGATLRTIDGGKTWKGVYAKKVAGGSTTNGMDVTTCYGVHFDPFNPKHVFISYTDIGLFASEDGGASWKSVTQTAPRAWHNTTYWMEFDPELKGRVWAVMSGVHDLPRPKMWRQRGTANYNGGVAVSDDGGMTWRKASETLPPAAATHIVIDPKSPASSRTLYITATGRGVFKSTDGGANWTLKNDGIETKDPLAWRLSRDRDGMLYLVVARRSETGGYNNDGDGALYRSTDGADHWQRIKLPEGVNGPNGIAPDPKDPKRLYLATWGRQGESGAVNGGIYLSTDAGVTWKNALDRDQHIYDVTIDPRDASILYACGFEDSAWRSRDRGQTWERIRGYNFKWGHRVVPDPFNKKMIYVTTFGGSVWYGPADGDPSAGEDIATPEVAHARK